MSPVAGKRALVDIVEEHFDELEWLQEHREANLRTPDWTLGDLAAHEARIEAHLDGLRIAGPHGWDLALERLEADDSFTVTAAAMLLLDRIDDGDVRGRLTEAFASGPPAVMDGIRMALRHHEPMPLAAELDDLAGRGHAGALDVLAFRRALHDAPPTTWQAEDDVLLACRLAAAGRRAELTDEALQLASEHPEARIRQAGYEAAARSRLEALPKLCRAAATRLTDPDPVAVRFLGVLADESALETLLDSVEQPATAASAIQGLGALGKPRSIPALLAAMADEDLGTHAVAAYRRITGADQIEGEAPFPPPEDDEGNDALPPDPARAAADWRARKATMDKESRWQGGFDCSAPIPADFDHLTLEARFDLAVHAAWQDVLDVPECEALATRQRVR